MEYTFSQLLSRIDARCFPPSATDQIKTDYVNKVRNRFYNSAFGQIWNGTDIALALAVIIQPDLTRTITLPRGVETLIGVYDSCGIQEIRNKWFSYTRLSPSTPSYWNGVDDIGYFCGIADLPTAGSTMAVTTTATESGGLTITFVGTDVNSIKITETLTIPTVSGNTVTTSRTFYSVNEVYLSVTAGDLIVNIGSTLYARYQPNEIFPKYRRYRFNECTQDTAVHAICKREFIELAGNDPMDINNLPAIEAGLYSFRDEMSGDYAHASGSMRLAVDYLNGELARYQGETSELTVRIEPLTGFGQIWNIE